MVFFVDIAYYLSWTLRASILSLFWFPVFKKRDRSAFLQVYHHCFSVGNVTVIFMFPFEFMSFILSLYRWCVKKMYIINFVTLYFISSWEEAILINKLKSDLQTSWYKYVHIYSLGFTPDEYNCPKIQKRQIVHIFALYL